MTKITLTWHGGTRFVGRSASGAQVPISFPAGETLPSVPSDNAGLGPAVAAQNAVVTGPMPTELLLMAAGACSGLDIVSLLDKMQVSYTGLEIEVEGRRAPEHPRYFTDISVVFRLASGPDALPALRRAAGLSMDRYCGVGHSLRATKTWRCEITDRRAPSGVPSAGVQ